MYSFIIKYSVKSKNAGNIGKVCHNKSMLKTDLKLYENYSKILILSIRL